MHKPEGIINKVRGASHHSYTTSQITVVIDNNGHILSLNTQSKLRFILI